MLQTRFIAQKFAIYSVSKKYTSAFCLSIQIINGDPQMEVMSMLPSILKTKKKQLSI
jgi:hypothetical protein